MSRYQVVITDGGFDEEALRVLRDLDCEVKNLDCQTPEDIIEAAQDAHAILNGGAPITKEVIEALHNCKVIVRTGVGYDDIDVEAAAESGIPVCNVPDATTDEVADHTMALALAGARRLTLADRALRQGEWNPTKNLTIPALQDMRFITIGFGNIAQAIHQRAAAFGFERLAFDPHTEDEVFDEAGVLRVELDEAIGTADILSLNAPLNDQTHHLLNTERFAQLKRGVVLVNTGRGALIETEALLEALKNGAVRFAALDVFEEEPLPAEHPLCRLDNVLLTPHIGAYSERSGPAVHRMAAQEVACALRGEPLRSQVNE